MNLHENINRIKEVMEILNEDWKISLRRRIQNIDELIPSSIRKIKDDFNICKYTVDSYVGAVAANTIEHMYWDFFSDIDDGSEEWIKMYDTMEKYIFDKFGQELRVNWQINCLMGRG
jgi:hypothetical protein